MGAHYIGSIASPTARAGGLADLGSSLVDLQQLFVPSRLFDRCAQAEWGSREEVATSRSLLGDEAMLAAMIDLASLMLYQLVAGSHHTSSRSSEYLVSESVDTNGLGGDSISVGKGLAITTNPRLSNMRL